jgi:hypothetical protein
MWNLLKTCPNYLNYVVLNNWGLTKGNLLYSTQPPPRKRPMSKRNRLIIAGPAALITVPLIYPANTHLKRGPDFTDQGMTPTGMLQFGPSR